MTTVGYGDVYPMEVGGYLATAIVMVIGLMVTALPVAIIGGNFTVVYEYNHKRNNQKESDSRHMEKVCTYLNQSKGNKDLCLSVSSVRPFDDWVIASVNWFYKTLWDIQHTFAALIIHTGVTLSQEGRTTHVVDHHTEPTTVFAGEWQLQGHHRDPSSSLNCKNEINLQQWLTNGLAASWYLDHHECHRWNAVVCLKEHERIMFIIKQG